MLITPSFFCCTQVRERIAAAGLRVVGWYRTHPDFPSDPSVSDILTQEALQQVFMDATGSQPFVGAIISPYNARYDAYYR